MVNVGGPSKGCRTCISRKIRCDHQVPICGQCQKSKRHCGGYRDLTETIFRNQSEVTITKAASRKQSKKTQPSGATALISEECAGRRVPPSQDDLARSPKLDEVHGLISFFANNFTCSDATTSGSNLFWVPVDFDKLMKHRIVNITVQGAGAMALARLQRSPYYLREAQKRYSEAVLELTNRGLRGNQPDHDALVLAVQFLGFFEILACYDMASRGAWITHLMGVGNISAQKQARPTIFDVRAHMQTRSQVIVNALLTRTAVPPVFVRPIDAVHNGLPQRLVPSDHLDVLLIRLAGLQASSKAAEAPISLVHDLQELDADLVRWTEAVPASWNFSKQASETPAGPSWSARCDVYPSAIIAHVWNKCRAARILTLDIIRRSPPSTQRADELIDQRHTQVLQIQHLAIDICATVPTFYRPRSMRDLSDNNELRPPLGCTYWLFWVLEVVATMIEAPGDLTRWVQSCLMRIHETTGIEVARKVSHRIGMRHKFCPSPDVDMAWQPEAEGGVDHLGLE